MNRMQRHEEVRVFREGLASPNVPAARVSFGLDPKSIKRPDTILEVALYAYFYDKVATKVRGAEYVLR